VVNSELRVFGFAPRQLNRSTASFVLHRLKLLSQNYRVRCFDLRVIFLREVIAMETKLEKEVRFLKIYALVATLFCAVFLLSAFTFQNKKQKFEEIDVERINVLDKDGKLRMVIANKDRQHPGVIDGKTAERERKTAGILFFNHLGDECGGLIFDENGGNGHFVSLTYDKVRHSETMRLQHLEGDNGQYSAGRWLVHSYCQACDNTPTGQDYDRSSWLAVPYNIRHLHR